MNKVLYILIIFFTLFSCNTSKKQDIEITSEKLQESFESKNEDSFLYQFPKDFDCFRVYFGWDNINDKPQYLYNEANDYIDYWFNLLNKHKQHEKDLISICEHGSWEPDAVNYLQDKTIQFIKNKKKYYLINELSDEDAKSVLFFLFDKPQPKLDAEFTSKLTLKKKNIIEDLFKTAYFDANENPDPVDAEATYQLKEFENNDHYFIRNLDINNDGVSDKIVSATSYQGNELLLFINKGNSFEFALKTTNFSEDGGNQIVDISKTKNGFVIFTAFLDRGILEAHHHIKFINEEWILTHTVYKTESSNEEQSFIYNCTVNQNINLNDTQLLSKLKMLPIEDQRKKVCEIESF